MRRGQQHLAQHGLASQEIGQAWSLGGRREHRVQRAAANVAVDDHGAVATVGERHAEVGRDERLPVTRAGARNGEHHRANAVQRFLSDVIEL